VIAGIHDRRRLEGARSADVLRFSGLAAEQKKRNGEC
jgi:hypothetical protein